MHVLGQRRGGDLLRRQPDALVDHLEAGVAGPDGDLLGAVGVPVQAGLADQQAQPARAELVGRAGHLLADLVHRRTGLGGDRDRGRGDSGGGAELAEHLAQGAGPLAGGDTGAGALQRGFHQVLGARRGLLEALQRLLGGGEDERVAVPLAVRGLLPLGAPAADALDGQRLHGAVDRHDGAVQVGRERVLLGLLVAVDTDDLVLAGLDPRPPLGVRGDQLALQVPGLDGRHGAAHLLDPVDLGQAVGDQGVDFGLDDVGSGEDVVVLQQVALEREDLLDAQRPLLVPGPGQTQRLVPGGQLHGAGAGVLGEGDREHLQHDALDVVLRLGLGQTQGVDLDAVTEATLLRVLDAVALVGDLVPDAAEGAHLAHLLDEADARVHEEGDPGDDLAEALRGHLARVAHRVEDRDRRGHRVRDLLDRGGPGLLEVVRADVDRVPLGDVVDRVRDHVRRQPQGRPRREDVRPAREVLLDDVVLGGALEQGDVRALLLGGHLVERQQPHGRGVDRHRGVHLLQGYVLEQPTHVAQMGDRDPDPAHLAAGEDVVGVVSGLGRQVEGDRQTRLALGEVAAVQLVGRLGRGVAGVRPHEPRTVLLALCHLRLSLRPLNGLRRYGSG